MNPYHQPDVTDDIVRIHPPTVSSTNPRSRARPSLFASMMAVALVLTTGWSTALAEDQAMGSAGTTVGHPERWAPEGDQERLTPENCAVLFIDHQAGLMNLVDNVEMDRYKADVMAKAKTAKLHGLPVVLTTSAENGPNGPILPEILEMFPEAPLISRSGQINAWDDPNFRKAVEETGRKKVVVSGITTDVCVAFVTLSMLEAGYDVYVVVDASGTTNPLVQQAALMRMTDAGAEMGNWFAFACEMLSDWRNAEGAGSATLFAEHMPGYAEAMASHAAFTEDKSGKVE
ncbi:MAG: isochorismatase family protein [Verrucomicrobiota bacterium]